jgi:hypothetical protein
VTAAAANEQERERERGVRRKWNARRVWQ